MDILVFKTNLEDQKHLRKLFPVLKNIEGVMRWNVDLEDHEKILRIEAECLSPRFVESALSDAGYFCEELED